MRPWAWAATALSVLAIPAPAFGAPVIAAAGDIACRPGLHPTRTTCRQAWTAMLLVGHPRIKAVLALGDEQYPSGASRDFRGSYRRTWGRVRGKTRPVPGNHEYRESRARGYFRYFGARAGPPGKGWYAYRVGRWHLIALNGNCTKIGGCGRLAPQTRWLRSNLRHHHRRCTLAYWHQPRFASGGTHGNLSIYSTWWRMLYAHDVDVVLGGHDHLYERYARQTPRRVRDRRHGIRQFIVGTGGVGLARPRGMTRNLQFRQHRHFGVLKLTLHPRRYDWRFVTGGHRILDSGSTRCH
jgi:acid phosphatase type 7